MRTSRVKSGPRTISVVERMHGCRLMVDDFPRALGTFLATPMIRSAFEAGLAVPAPPISPGA